MPKTRRPKSWLTKPVSSAPSSLTLSTDTTVSREDGSPARTVNELLHDSRRAQNQNLSAESIQASSSIHPTLRAVLNIPAPTPPPPRHGLSGSRLRRVPGPPAPRSWLLGNMQSPPDVFPESGSSSHEMVPNHATLLPNAVPPSEKSLQHMAMKSMATNWHWHAHHDHEYLADLPVNMKEILLSYISMYNDKTNINPLRVLFPWSSPADDDQVTRIDLSNAVGCWTTPKLIDKDFTRGEKRSQEEHRGVMTTTNKDSVPETWEEDEEMSHTKPKIAPSIDYNVRFKNLKHLSLAVTPSTSGTVASWQDLLNLAGKLPTIGSLSLAYWPQPTFTPIASMGRYKVQRLGGSGPSIIYGGSDFYTESDGNWREAAGILRTLSRSFYCLEWLDLTGCGPWLSALTWQSENEGDPDVGPDWNGSWRRISHLTLGVGWKPAPFAQRTNVSIEIPKRERPDRIASRLSDLSISRAGVDMGSDQAEMQDWNVDEQRAIYMHRRQVERCMELFNSSKKVAQDLRILRKQNGGKWIDVDFGKSEFW